MDLLRDSTKETKFGIYRKSVLFGTFIYQRSTETELQ